MSTVKVLQIFASLGMGGAESRMMDVYRNIDQTVYTFDFLTMQDGVQHYESELAASGARVIHIQNPRQVNVLRHISQLRRVMKDGQYDAVHAHTSYHCGIALFAAWIAHVPVRIAHARTTGSKQHSLKSKVASMIGRALIRLFSTERLAISRHAGEYLFGKMRFTVVPNTICVEKYMDVSAEQTKDLKNELKIPEHAFVIGQIGRFDEMKNHRFTLHWFAEYRRTHADAHLVLVGDGTLRAEMEAFAKDLQIGSAVTFTGVRADVPQLIHVFNMLLFPSLFEGLGGVVLEAQAAGIPTVESENIPPEADLGLGMVLRCRLQDELSCWSEAVDRCREYASPDRQTIEAAFDAHGYSIEAVRDTYCQLYKGKSK